MLLLLLSMMIDDVDDNDERVQQFPDTCQKYQSLVRERFTETEHPCQTRPCGALAMTIAQLVADCSGVSDL
jgi:hypothetical protein